MAEEVEGWSEAPATEESQGTHGTKSRGGRRLGNRSNEDVVHCEGLRAVGGEIGACRDGHPLRVPASHPLRVPDSKDSTTAPWAAGKLRSKVQAATRLRSDWGFDLMGNIDGE